MTKAEMIATIIKNPNTRFTHNLFAEESDGILDITTERKEDGNIYDECGCLFEDWHSTFNCGIRIRTGEEWEKGWRTY